MRKGDWETALDRYFAESEARPHVYGSHDCILFAGGSEMAMTGNDPVAHIRGRYRSQAGAFRLLKQLGFTSLEEAVDAAKPEVAIGFARRGDWALHADGAVGVVATGRFALFLGAIEDPAGVEGPPKLIRVPRHEWRKAWSVE